MKKTVSFILVLSVIVSSLLLFGCSAGKKIDASEDLQRIKDAGVLKIGMECNYIPYNWTQFDDSNGAVKIANTAGYANGFDVLVAKKIADALGVKLEVYAYKWESLIPAVESGALDCIVAGMSPSAERKETVDFSE
ncbi:MAG: transporter substrate-binding domain-containing protein, partial [Firmicutes bacterium]|nr:transporter substrate-binding domain-containing protein [Candidatus Colimorpha enterica]